MPQKIPEYGQVTDWLRATPDVRRWCEAEARRISHVTGLRAEVIERDGRVAVRRPEGFNAY